MATAAKGYNKNNAGVKRILREAAELASDPSPEFHAAPLENNLFDWHCTLRGPSGTEFEGGLYHFRIVLPAEYPFRPPSVILLTPNGRFEVGTKICISFTNYHEELWQPAWGVRTAIVALQGFFPLKGQAAIGVGAVEYPESERRRLAVLSRDWTCPDCGCANKELLDPQIEGSNRETVIEPVTQEAVKMENQASIATDKNSDMTPNSTPSEPQQQQQHQQQEKAPPPSPSENQSNTPPAPSQSEPVIVHHVEAIQGNRMIVTQAHPSRPPIILDATIYTLMVVVVALVIRKLL